MTLTAPARVVLIVAALAACVFLPAYRPVEAQRKQDNRALRMQEVKELPAKAKRYALVIGVDEYRDKQINRLYGAAKDSQTLRDALVKYAGFPEDQVTLLATGESEEREPSRANILQRLLNLNGLVPQDGLLLVSFAGHGMQRGERGFILPSDAKIGSLSQLENTAISVADVKRFIRQTGVRQVLVIMDACRNDPGGRADSPNPMSGAYRFDFDTRNQEVEAFATLYATDVGNRAYEYTEKNQGYFTWFLIEGLKGEAANARGEVTLSGVVRYLLEKVPKRVLLDLGQEKKQRPWADVQGYKAEELVISAPIRVPPLTSAVSALDPAVIELELWSSIKSSADPDDFRAYLEKYPNGTFAGVARNRVRQLEAAAKPAPNPVNLNAPDTSAMPKAPINAADAKANPTAGPGSLPLRAFKFDVVTVNSSGAEMSRRKGQAQYCVEDAASISLELVSIPAGAFLMGSTEYDNEKPPHQVTVGAFYMGKYEVTQAQWRAVARLPKVSRDVDSDPSKFKGDNLPVEQVSWEDAVEFCARLSRATSRSYRLPTEAEWEYACRAGTTTPFAFGETTTPQLVNYNSNYPYAQAPKGTYREATMPVGFMGVANGFGLFDMHGNVWEWCMDYWHENYNGAPTDGRSWETAGETRDRVLRGGAWGSFALVCRSAYRTWSTPRFNLVNFFGFRVVAGARTP